MNIFVNIPSKREEFNLFSKASLTEKYVAVRVVGAAMNVREYHVSRASRASSSSASGTKFQGRLQGLMINGERILDEAHLKQIDYEGNKSIIISQLQKYFSAKNIDFDFSFSQEI